MEHSWPGAQLNNLHWFRPEEYLFWNIKWLTALIVTRALLQDLSHLIRRFLGKQCAWGLPVGRNQASSDTRLRTATGGSQISIHFHCRSRALARRGCHISSFSTYSMTSGRQAPVAARLPPPPKKSANDDESCLNAWSYAFFIILWCTFQKICCHTLLHPLITYHLISDTA